MNLLIIHGIELSLKIGILNWEKKHPQKILVNLDIGLVNNEYVNTDNINDTINYAKIVNDIKNRYSKLSFALIESLANDIADFLIKKYFLRTIKVYIEKPGILPNVKKVGVIINKESKNKLK